MLFYQDSCEVHCCVIVKQQKIIKPVRESDKGWLTYHNAGQRSDVGRRQQWAMRVLDDNPYGPMHMTAVGEGKWSSV